MLPLSFTHRSFPNTPDVSDAVGVFFGGVTRPCAYATLVRAAPPRCSHCEAYLFHGCVWRMQRWKCGLCGQLSADDSMVTAPKDLAVEWVDATLSTRLAVICVIDLTCKYDLLDAIVRGVARALSTVKAHAFGLVLCAARHVALVELGGGLPCIVNVRVTSARGGLAVPLALATNMSARALCTDVERFIQALSLVRAVPPPTSVELQPSTLALAVDSLMLAVEPLAGARLLVFSSALAPEFRFTGPPMASVELFTDAAGAAVPANWSALVRASGGHVSELSAVDVSSAEGLAPVIARRLPAQPAYRCLVKLRTIPELFINQPNAQPWWRIFVPAPAPPIKLLGDGCTLDGETWSVACANADAFTLGFELGFTSAGGLDGVGFTRKASVQVASTFTRADEHGVVRRYIRVETRSPAHELGYDAFVQWDTLDAPVVALCLMRNALDSADAPDEARAAVQLWAQRVARSSQGRFAQSPLCRLVYGVLRSPEMAGAGFDRPKLAHLLSPAQLAKYLWPRLVALDDAAMELALVPASLAPMGTRTRWLLDAVTHVAVIGEAPLAALVAQVKTSSEHALGDVFALDYNGSAEGDAPFSPGASETSRRIAVGALLWEDAFAQWRAALA